ncbi:UPF0524 protein C3orf70 homolog B isoform X2 [Melanotaenia boesemani]|uniref:UPF0524 protein C3orf70 homolog B isoform X2 n=1 Tax=Melanotaenia boesemani TaxID=1250792 RepID=UPI001C049E78|nr:UPF0524 protein C3orf70 homolog B isoform X2 [Melanotaenia boesemani]
MCFCPLHNYRAVCSYSSTAGYHLVLWNQFLGQGKYVYQPMTNVCQLPSTTVPPLGSECSNTMDLSVSLAERFLKLAPSFQSPPHLESPKYCVIADLFVDDYIVKRINGKMCYVQRPPPPLPEPPRPPTPLPPAPETRQMPINPTQPQQPLKTPPPPPTQHTPPPVQPVQQVYSDHKHPSPVDKIKGPKMDHCSSPSSSEDSGINALGLHYLESCEEESEEEDDELSTDGNSSPGSLWDQDDCSLLSPSKSMIEIIEKIETTV